MYIIFYLGLKPFIEKNTEIRKHTTNASGNYLFKTRKGPSKTYE